MRQLCIIFVTILLIASCADNIEYTPKPMAYQRISLPQKDYVAFDTSAICFRAEIPTYCNIEIVDRNTPSKNWINMIFPSLNASIFTSYKSMSSPKELPLYIDSCLDIMSIHNQKSSGIEEIGFVNSDSKVYATIYHIKGRGVASPYQFWVTDSNKHFLRGSLYFNSVPNNDSIAPIIDFISEDIKHLIETIKWK